MARLAPLRTPSSIRASSSAPIAPRGAPDPARRGVAVHSSSAADPNAAQSRDAPWSPCLALLRVCLYQNPTLNPPRYSTPGRDSHREPCLPFAEPFFGLAFFSLAASGLGTLHGLPHGLTSQCSHHRVYDHVSYPAHVATYPHLLARFLCKGKGGPHSDPPFRPLRWCVPSWARCV